MNDIYWIDFEELEDEHTTPKLQDTLSIITDYCLISKNSNKRHVEFVIAGLRAYGQRAAYDFLNDIDFYRAIEDLFDYRFFRVLVRVSVSNTTVVRPWEVVEEIGGESENEWKVNNRQLKIFLSYLKDDWKNKVALLEERLRQEDFKVLVDKRNIDPGSRWKGIIRKLVKQTDVFLVCFSENYAKRDTTYVDYEVDIALKENKSIIPVRFHECKIHPSLQVFQWSDLFGNWRRKRMYDWTMKDWIREKNLRTIISMLYEKQLQKIRNE